MFDPLFSHHLLFKLGEAAIKISYIYFFFGIRVFKHIFNTSPESVLINLFPYMDSSFFVNLHVLKVMSINIQGAKLNIAYDTSFIIFTISPDFYFKYCYR